VLEGWREALIYRGNRWVAGAGALDSADRREAERVNAHFVDASAARATWPRPRDGLAYRLDLG